jgi:hypothetical protein
VPETKGRALTDSADHLPVTTTTSSTTEDDDDDTHMSILAAKERTSKLLDSWLPIRARPDEVFDRMSFRSPPHALQTIIDLFVCRALSCSDTFDTAGATIANLRTRAGKTPLRKKFFKKPRGVFGIPLADLQEGRQVPIIVMQCVSFLSKPGTLTCVVRIDRYRIAGVLVF